MGGGEGGGEERRGEEREEGRRGEGGKGGRKGEGIYHTCKEALKLAFFVLPY